MGPESASSARRSALDRGLRAGYLVLGAFLLAFLLRRGVDCLRDRVITDPRFAFAPALARVVPRPNWVGAAFDRCVRRRLETLAGCSVLHPGFRAALAARLHGVPWIRSVDAVTLDDDGRVVVTVKHHSPVARLEDGSRYVDASGRVLPPAGPALRLPWIRSRDGTSLDPVERLVAAQEASYLLERTGCRGPIWRSLLGIEVTAERRLDDGRAYSRLGLVFARLDAAGTCRVQWGRGRAEARPCDLAPEGKLEGVRRIFRSYPGWRGIEEGNVAFSRALVRPEGTPPGMTAHFADVEP